jgi:hypothetical protein
MQLLLADYARYYNRRYGRSGHLFQARYNAILVEDGEYLFECSRYIHLNPNRKTLTRPAELWPWSSYRNFVGGPVAVDWVCTNRILAHFGSPEDYRAYVESGRDEKPLSPFERATAGLVLGSPAFVERIRALEKGLRPVRDLTGRRALRQSGDLASYELLAASVEKHFAKLSECRRRQILAFVLYRLTWLKTTQIADLLERSPAAISMARHRVELRIEDDPALATALRLLEQEVQGETAAGSPAEESTTATPAWYRAALSRFPLAPVRRKI